MPNKLWNIKEFLTYIIFNKRLHFGCFCAKILVTNFAQVKDERIF